MRQEKIGQWGATKDKIQEDQITMTLPNTGKWNKRLEVVKQTKIRVKKDRLSNKMRRCRLI